MKHSPFGPSALQSLEACPSFRSSGESSEAAERGTRIHEAIDSMIQGVSVELADADEQALALWGFEWAQAQMGEHPHLEWKSEQQVNSGIPAVWGTADLLGICPMGSEAVVWDFKTGWSKRAPAHHNRQLQAYALGADRAAGGVGRVTIGIVNLDAKKMDYVSVGREALNQWREEIAYIVGLAIVDDPDNRAAGTQCRYCERAATCPMVVREIDQIAKGAEVALDEGRGELAKFLRANLETANAMTDLVGKIKAKVMARMEIGELFDGLVIEEKAGNRVWLDDPIELLESQGIEAFERKPISPAEAEKALIAGGLKPKEAKAFLEQITGRGAAKKSLKVRTGGD